MMMVVPIDAEVNKAENVGQEHRQDWSKRCEIGTVRHLHFQHHNRDDDGDNAVAECLKPVRFHETTVIARYGAKAYHVSAVSMQSYNKILDYRQIVQIVGRQR